MNYHLVYPGLALKVFKSGDELSLGIGAYLRRNEYQREIRSAVIGAYKSGTHYVFPRRGPYMPRLNDDVVGIIVSEEPSYLRVDIRAPYSAHFRPAEDEVYPVGTVIRGKIVEFDLKRNPVISTKRLNNAEEYGPIDMQYGLLVELSPNKLGAILGPKLSNIQLLQEKFNVKIYPGRNGRFAIVGEDLENVFEVRKILLSLDRAPSTKLVRYVREVLNKI